MPEFKLIEKLLYKNEQNNIEYEDTEENEVSISSKSYLKTKMSLST